MRVNVVSFFAHRGRLTRIRCYAGSACHVTVLTLNPLGVVRAITPLVIGLFYGQLVERVRYIVAGPAHFRLRMKIGVGCIVSRRFRIFMRPEFERASIFLRRQHIRAVADACGRRNVMAAFAAYAILS